MGDVVNLNKFRKAKALAEKEAKADENRAKYGRRKSDRNAAEAEETRRLSALEGHAKNPSAEEEQQAGEDNCEDANPENG